jgi:enediyne biosynthesis protein E4
MLCLVLLVYCTGCRPSAGQRGSAAGREGVQEGSVRGDATGIRFTDVTAAPGVRFRHVNGAAGKKTMPETMGSGCAFLDFDGDGRLDLFLVNSRALPGTSSGSPALPALYRNQGGAPPVFRDVTAGSGLDVSMYGMGVAVGDYDNDGRDDLYVTAALEPGRLFRNEGDSRFRDVTRAAGVGNEGHWGTSAVWLDYDRDSDLDLFVCNYIQYDLAHDLVCKNRLGQKSYCTPHHYPPDQSALFRNEGGPPGAPRFTDVSTATGVATPAAKALGVAIADFDGDSWPDLYVASDTTPNLLLHNRRGRHGTRVFREEGLETGVAYGESGLARAGMGVDTTWLEGEGGQEQLAIGVANFTNEPISLFAQDAPGMFTDRTYEAGLATTHMELLGFGLFFFDADNDGRSDLFVTNGHVQDDIHLFQNNLRYAQRCQLFRGDGGVRFTEMGGTAGEPFRRERVGRGAVYGDVDNDGDLDILLSNNGGPAELLRNDTSPRGHWLQVETRGTRSNRHGLGAEVIVSAGGRRQRQWVRGGSSYCSASMQVPHFGLGEAARVESVEVLWPSGKVSRLGHQPADQRLIVREP